jgi:orotate phosphoribosyltransferase
VIDKESLITALHDLGVVKVGEAEEPPVQVNIGLLIARPATLRRAARTLDALATRLAYDRLAATPSNGLPLAVALSLVLECPLIYPRLESGGLVGHYVIEGLHQPGETALVVDGELRKAADKLETITQLEAARLRVSDVLVLINNQLGGEETLTTRGCRVHSVLTLREILHTLLSLERIAGEQHQRAITWLADEAKKS